LNGALLTVPSLDDETLISDTEVRLFKRFKDNSERCLNQLLPEMRIDNFFLDDVDMNFHCLLFLKPCLDEVTL
jgi:hypothetical protein